MMAGQHVETRTATGPPGRVRAAEGVLAWIGGSSEARVIAGRERRHASMEGNALFVCCRLGLARDGRVRSLVETLLRSQWPDGGWNCDGRPEAMHSSVHETVTPIRGLAADHAATGDPAALEAALRGADLLLSHRLFRRSSNGEVIHPELEAVDCGDAAPIVTQFAMEVIRTAERTTGIRRKG